jgi:hypothetical protein
MTEETFWNFMEKEWKKGRISIVSIGTLGDPDPAVRAQMDYIDSHVFLPKNHETIPAGMLINMGKLLFEKGVKTKTKKAILVLLAHRGAREVLNILRTYSANPDRDLKIFTKLAVRECESWMK